MSTRTEFVLRRHALAAAVALSCAGSGHAADIGVNNAGAGSVASACTVLDAVAAVNTQAAVNGCVAGDGNNDTIDLTGFATPTAIVFASASSFKTTSAPLVLSKAVTIKGALDAGGKPLVGLQRSTVSGTPQFSIIASSADLTLDGLTVSNGSSQTHGGGIYTTGSQLAISRSIITGNNANSAGAVFTTAQLTITNSTISGNTAAYVGGAYVQGLNGTFSITGSTFSSNSSTHAGSIAGALFAIGGGTIDSSSFSGNSAGYGGAVGVIGLNAIPLTITNSKFTGNSAAAFGGAIFQQRAAVSLTGSTLNGNSAAQKGGAIATAQNGGSVSLVNSTISGNVSGQSGGGVYAYGATLSYSTLYANQYTTAGSKGAGLFFVHAATVQSSILFGNGNDDIDAPSNIGIGGSYSIFRASGINVPASSINCAGGIHLGPLANFGGPTKTLPLLSGSCAIDVASANPTVATDQRGFARPATINLARADVGAFEKQSASDPDFIFIDGFGTKGSD